MYGRTADQEAAMPRPRTQEARYCLHKPSGQAYVTIDRKCVYLGPYGSQESRDKYLREINDWIARGRPLGLPMGNGPVTLNQVLLAFSAHARSVHPAPPVPAGRRPAGELGAFFDNMRLLRRLYGPTPAAEFGPRALKAVIQAMIELGWCRTRINRELPRIKRILKWAGSEELIPGSVYESLRTVEGLRRGRTAARESEPVKPVNESHAEATLAHVPAEAAAIARLQLLTGARPGELVMMTGAHLDTAGEIWTYSPPHHKTAHHGHKRQIFIGPQAQSILRPWLKPDLQARLFSYSRQSYCRAINNGCKKAFPPPAELARKRVPAHGRKATKSTRWKSRCEWCERPGKEGWAKLKAWQKAHHWCPLMMRHTAGTKLRREHGIELAQTILGHGRLNDHRDLRRGERAKGRAGPARGGVRRNNRGVRSSARLPP
jgi:integrase